MPDSWSWLANSVSKLQGRELIGRLNWPQSGIMICGYGHFRFVVALCVSVLECKGEMHTTLLCIPMTCLAFMDKVKSMWDCILYGELRKRCGKADLHEDTFESMFQ